MTRAQSAAMIEGIGYPAAYYQFDEGTAQEPPFICYYYTGRQDFFADDANYQKIAPLIVELYTDAKDIEAEERVEAALASAGITYTTSEETIESEALYMVAYSTEVLING